MRRRAVWKLCLSGVGRSYVLHAGCASRDGFQLFSTFDFYERFDHGYAFPD
jgi:hypothetical protein